MSSRIRRAFVPSKPLAALLALPLALAACDCGQSSSGPSRTDGADASSGGSPISSIDGGSGRDAALGGPISPGSRTDYCQGSGPPVLLGEGGRTLCTGQLAGTVFRRALCTCGDFSSNGGLRTSSFDSTTATSMDVSGGASVGVNGLFNPNRAIELGGSLDVGGDAAVLNGDARIHGRLAVDGEISFAARTVTVRGDVIANGPVQGGTLATTGTLHVPAGALVSASGAPMPAFDASPVADPCECGSATFLDVASWVRSYATTNDDSEVEGWDPMAVANFRDGATLDVPCGRLHLETMAGIGTLTLRVRGRSALFVEGSVNVGGLVVELDPGAELDLFVEGSLTTRGALMLGTTDAPRRVRLYVGGSTVNLQGATLASGNVYAPHANLTTGSSGLVLHGALFVGSLNPNGDLEIHYDRGVLDGSADCAPPPSCASCLDCGGQACTGGQCGSCATDADCCSPLVCVQGACTLAIELE